MATGRVRSAYLRDSWASC